VLEDQILLDAGKSEHRRFRPPILPAALRVLRHLGQRITRRFRKFGTATVSFGEPLSLRDLDDPKDIEALGVKLMARIAEVVPLLPVPLVAHALVSGATNPSDVRAHIDTVIGGLNDAGAVLPRRSVEKVVEDGLSILVRRGLVRKGAGSLALVEGSRDLLGYYARSIAHHVQSSDDAATRRT